MHARKQLLVIDDDAPFRDLVQMYWENDEALDVHGACDGAQGLAFLEQHSVGVVILDLTMPGIGGMEVLQKITEMDDPIEVIVVTGYGSIDSAVTAMRHGAFHFLPKPLDLEDLEVVVGRAFEQQQTRFERNLLQAAVQRGDDHVDQPVIAVSKAMRDVFQEARVAASMEAPVLIEGETGAGKEVLANYIHRLSNRSTGPFNIINCAAIPDSLVDSEFFGHTKGAFTGAGEARKGIIEVSHKGSLLLDEIGDISATAQMRLLRVLEYGKVRPVGSTKETTVDVRIIAATHRKLETLIAQRVFREDLYHRLLVIRLRVPPLRERLEDIVPLAEFFLDRLCLRYGDMIALNEDAHDILCQYHWLGNVRELRNVIERGWFASLRDGAGSIHAKHINFLRSDAGTDSHAKSKESGASTVTMSLRDVELAHIQRVLEHCKGNRRKAATTLGISERNLYRKVQELEGLET